MSYREKIDMDIRAIDIEIQRLTEMRKELIKKRDNFSVIECENIDNPRTCQALYCKWDGKSCGKISSRFIVPKKCSEYKNERGCKDNICNWKDNQCFEYTLEEREDIETLKKVKQLDAIMTLREQRDLEEQLRNLN